MARIFISYSRQDQLFVRRLATDLERLGADIWLDVDDIPVGVKWSSAIQQGLDSTEVMIVVITPYSMSSKNVEDEWQYFQDRGKPIVLVLLEPARMHFQLARIQYIDFHTKPYDQALKALHDHLGQIGAALNPIPDDFVSSVNAKSITLRPGPVAKMPGATPDNITSRWLLFASAGVVLVALILVGIWAVSRGPLLSPTASATGNEVQPTSVAIIFNASSEQTATASASDEAGTPTVAATLPPTATIQPSDTPSSTPTVSPTTIPTSTQTSTLTDTATNTPTNTATNTSTVVPTTAPGASRYDNYGVAQVWVPAGCFQMGSDPAVDSAAQKVEQPAHKVCFNQGYWIDQFEVTNGDYQKFVDAGGYTEEKYWSKDGWKWVKATGQVAPKAFPGTTTDSQYPRIGVSWYEAEAYANWRGGRLPTEAEWEYAARGPQSLIYPWGNSFDPNNPQANIAKVSDSIASVGAFTLGTSWIHAFDMSGNVWEWTADWFNNNTYVQTQDGAVDPMGPPNGTQKVLRGGAFSSSIRLGRSAYRSQSEPLVGTEAVGFRIVTLDQ